VGVKGSPAPPTCASRTAGEELRSIGHVSNRAAELWDSHAASLAGQAPW